MANNKSMTPRTIAQLVEGDDPPPRACHTESLWVDNSETDVFGVPTSGNKIESLTTGMEYFERLIEDCDNATSEIYIAGWQVNWDALLVKGVRLYDLIYRCALRGVKIYVMPWDDTEPVQTYDDQTKIVLESINVLLGKSGANGRVTVQLSPSYAENNNSYFSHHQKQVVIDRKIAYVGGIDLAYGRMDDAQYDLRANARGREMLNRYNPGIPPLHKYKSNIQNIADPDLMVGVVDRTDIHRVIGANSENGSNSQIQSTRVNDGAWQVRYEKAGLMGTAPNNKKATANTPESTTLEPSRQPRMPWQDIQCRIEGPAVYDLIKNFVLRWNIEVKVKLALPHSSIKAIFPGAAKIQVLRSAPRLHCQKENVANSIPRVPRTQQDIHVGMIKLIEKARHFIYIEQQFFVSNFGELGERRGAALSPAGQYIKDGAEGIGDTKLDALRWLSQKQDQHLDRLPSNGVLPALLERFKSVIVDDITSPNFHVYMTLPVHPEGSLIDAAIAVQVYYTMQTIAFGSHSLLNGIRRLIKARELKDNKDPNYLRVVDDSKNIEYTSVPISSCAKYVTLLNLRNWAKIGHVFVTEQIYVHSKLMIVDDRFALLGSANINDRSLLGERDSELAVLVLDDDVGRADINGDGLVPVRTFAHQLRQKTWSKIFGITGGLRPADELHEAILKPGHPDSWKRIQSVAARNAAIYEASFSHIPRSFVIDSLANQKIAASILPTWTRRNNAKISTFDSSSMPFDPAFWQSPLLQTSVGELGKIKGYITALPVDWTRGENLKIAFPTPLVAKNDDLSLNNRPDLIAADAQTLRDVEKYV